MFEKRDHFEYDDGSAFVITDTNEARATVEVVERYPTESGHEWTKYVRPVSEIRSDVESGDLRATGHKLKPEHVSKIKSLTILPAHRISEIEQDLGIA